MVFYDSVKVPCGSLRNPRARGYPFPIIPRSFDFFPPQATDFKDGTSVLDPRDPSCLIGSQNFNHATQYFPNASQTQDSSD